MVGADTIIVLDRGRIRAHTELLERDELYRESAGAPGGRGVIPWCESSQR